MKTDMIMIRTAMAGLVLVCGAALVLSSQPTQHAVASDYLVRPTAVATQTLSDTTLSDWEYTVRNRAVTCRFGR